MAKKNEKTKIYRKGGDINEEAYLIALHEDLEKNEALSSESFYGIFKFLRCDKQHDRSGHPIVFIIKNIKNFPQQVLNDLIHMMKKYRD